MSAQACAVSGAEDEAAAGAWGGGPSRARTSPRAGGWPGHVATPAYPAGARP